jgi:hypothetical protein
MKLVLLAIGFVLAGLVVMFVFGAAWVRWGFGGAFLLFAVVLLLIGWLMDRRERKLRESLGE